jgi:hypothetical protein
VFHTNRFAQRRAHRAFGIGPFANIDHSTRPSRPEVSVPVCDPGKRSRKGLQRQVEACSDHPPDFIP